MPAVIPREGFEQRRASLKERRDALVAEYDARIAEIDHWLSVLDGVEAQHQASEPQAPKPARRRSRRTANGNSDS